MKKLLIIGAGGSLAQYVIEAVAPLKELQTTLFLRNKNRLGRQLPQHCRVIEGDAMRYADIEKAIAGQDMVYVNLAGNLEAMTTNIVKAMQQLGVQRIIAISSIGIYNSPLKPVLVPYRKLADIIEASGLDYTILRPDWFTSSNEIDYAITHKGEPESGSAISRKSIAAFIKKIVENPALHSRENLGISKPSP